MKILGRILLIALRHKRWLAAAYGCTIATTAAYLILPRLFGEAIDRIAAALEAGTLADRTLLWIFLLILGISVVRGAFGFGQAYLGEALGQLVVYKLRNQFYDHVQNLGFGFHDKQHTGNLMSRAITDVEAIRMFVAFGLIRAPYFLVLLIGVSVILLRLDWRLGLMSLSILPLVSMVAVTVRLHLGRMWTRVQEQLAELNTRLQENLTGVRVVKAFASERYEEERFDEKNTAVAGEMVKAERLHVAGETFMVFGLLMVMGLILWYGGSRVIGGHMTPGELAQFLFYLQVLALPVRLAGFVARNYARAIASGERLFEVLDAESPVRESSQAIEMPRARGHVRFDNVSFSYDRGVPVLQGIDVDAQPGQIIALLGAPGSGKSSAVHLIPRFYDVDSGRVTIDGTDVRDVSLTSLRRNIGMVQQDVFLFGSSIRENIAYGREDATLEEVIRAARVAQMDEFVDELDKGYDTELGERGVNLSGGQRQRLSIARAVLLDPPILVLDDSTSSVDANTEELIRTAMDAVMRGRTTFVIAHRLSTVHRADQILVLKEGRIAALGTHQELLAEGGLYRDIYELQLRPQEEVMREFDVPPSTSLREASA